MERKDLNDRGWDIVWNKKNTGKPGDTVRRWGCHCAYTRIAHYRASATRLLSSIEREKAKLSIDITTGNVRFIWGSAERLQQLRSRLKSTEGKIRRWKHIYRYYQRTEAPTSLSVFISNMNDIFRGVKHDIAARDGRPTREELEYLSQVRKIYNTAQRIINKL